MVPKSNYFKAFCKVSKAFGKTLTKEELLDLIVQSAIDTMVGKAACLFLADEEKDVFVPVAQKGLSKDYLHAKPMQAKKVVKAILKGGYLAIRDATTDPRVENHAAKKAEGIASILDVPVMVRDKAIGVLALYTATTRDFSQDEIDFLSALAEHGGMAIERARLLERIQNNTRLFLDLASNINSSLDIQKILHILSADIAEAMDVKAASILLIDENKQTLELVASYGLSDKYLDRGPLSVEKSIIETIKHGPVVIKDATRDKRVEFHKEKKEEGIVSILSAPINTREHVIGCLRLYTGSPREFSEEEIMMVSALAHTGGLAIQNATLYLELQDDIKDLQEDIWSHRSWF
ncbi:MAG: GAF domain-containing protein [Desulfobacterales bacterium]|nr:MAG: GAF domain-containing protein [Desulfobacterales bacterium]